MTALEEIKKALEGVTPDAWRYRMKSWSEQYWHYFNNEPRFKEPDEVWEPLYSPSSLASTLESLQRENEEKSAWIKAATVEITKAIGGGSEMFTKHGDDFRVDPVFIATYIQFRRERHAESKKASIQKERELQVRADAAEAEVERLRLELSFYACDETNCTCDAGEEDVTNVSCVSEPAKPSPAQEANTMQSEELKPCPFCGYALTTCEGICEGYAEGSEEEEVEFTGICCPGCAVFLPKQTEDGTAVDGIRAWNRRAEAALSAVEPVAWLVKHYDLDGILLDTELSFVRPTIRSTCRTDMEPLYAAPPAPSVAVKAIEYTEAIGEAAQGYFNSFEHVRIHTPGTFRFEKLWNVMQSAALSAQVQDVAGDEEWQTVPKHPTGRMIDAVVSMVDGDAPHPFILNLYRAMIAAAPAKQEG